MQQAELNKNQNKVIKAKTIPQILQEMDPTTLKEDTDKFMRHMDEILKSCKIADSKEDVVKTLREIESSLHYMIEARNYLYAKDEEMIRRFEQDVEKERKDRKFKEKQIEQSQKDAEIKQKQRERAEKQKEFVVFRGMPLVPRSLRKAFKPRVEKKDDMDEQTKDEKQYLAPELFVKLQNMKSKQQKE